jgi:hypothetical protein
VIDGEAVWQTGRSAARMMVGPAQNGWSSVPGQEGPGASRPLVLL